MNHDPNCEFVGKPEWSGSPVLGDTAWHCDSCNAVIPADGTSGRYVFNYPNFGTPDTHPDYSAHRGQTVTVLRDVSNLCDEHAHERMFRIRADDGWEGEAWESELEPVSN